MNPADLIDFDKWRLQLPIDTPEQSGVPDLYEKAELAAGFQISPWYVALDAVSAVQFRANIEGVTTSGSSYPRSELREMDVAGTTTQATWSGVTGTHVMEIRQAVTHAPVVKQQVVCGQIHNGSSDAVQIVYDTGKIKWRYNGTTQAEILNNAYTLGTVFVVKLEVIDGTLNLYYNGTLAATRSGLGGTTNYFKAGCYTQSNTSQGDSAGAYGEVLIYSLYVQHGTPTGVGYRNRSVGNTSQSGGSTVLPMPVGLKSGDRMYALLGSLAATPTITEPAGWTKVSEYQTGTTLKTALFYRDITAAAEPASYTWTWSSNGRTMALGVSYYGLDLAAAALGGTQSVTDSSSAPQTFAFATPQDGDWALFGAMAKESPGTDNVKSWTDSDSLDVKRHDNYGTNTGTGPRITGAWWDTGRGLPASTVQRTLTPSVPLTHQHAWGLRLAAPAGSGDPPPPSGVTTWSYIGQPQR